MSKPRESKKNYMVHENAIRNFGRIESALYNERRQSLEDRRFYSISGAQWEGEVGEQFEKKPKFEVNKVHMSVMRIINEYRANRITVNFTSKDGTDASHEADVCDMLFRADEQDSTAEEAYDNAFEEAVGGGLGAIRVISEYEDDEDEENERQRIRIEPIYDADSSVFFDLDAKRQDKADAKYCFVMYSMTHEDYKAEFNQEPSSMWKEIDYKEYDWYSPDLVYVAEYYLLEEVKETVRIFQNITGDEEKHYEEEFEENPDLERELAAIGTREIRTRTIKKKKVHKYIIDGNEILEDCGYLPGKCIPIVPVYGKRWFVDSVERQMGHVRLVKDTQRLKNMLMSKLAEISSLSTVEKPIFTPEQVSEHEWRWAEDNIKNFPYQLVNPVTDANGNISAQGPIGYTKPPQIPPALAALMQLVDVDQKEILGGTGEPDKLLSHVSAEAHALVSQRIDGQAYIYMSNFAKAIKRVGEVWLSIAKEIYVEKDRNMKTIDSMGQIGTVKLMQPSYSEDNKLTLINNISEANFDVTVSVGPSSKSQREATVRSLIGMLQITQDPQTAQVIQSMIMMNMEGDGIGEAREYFRKQLVQLGVIKPTEEEAQAMAEAAKNKQPDPQEVLMVSAAENEKAKAAKSRAEVLETMADTQKTIAETKEIYSEIDVRRALAAEDVIDRERQAAERRQQLAQQARQAQMVTQQGPNNRM